MGWTVIRTAEWRRDGFINRLTARVGVLEIDLHIQPGTEPTDKSVDWIVWDAFETVIESGIAANMAEAKAAAWIAVGKYLEYVPKSEEEAS